MMQRSSILISVVLAVMAVPAFAASGRYRITTEQIAATVTSSGVHVSPDQISLLSEVVSSVANPPLTVMSIDRAGDQRAVARLECTASDQCLPFLVALHIGPANSAEIVAAMTHGSTASSVRSKTLPVIVRAGSPAILLLNGTHVHVRLSVICLESGAQGQMIRAASQDHQVVFRVKVAGDGTLEGRL